MTEAIKQVKRAGELNPGDATVFFRIGSFYYSNFDYSNAIGSFERAVILDNSYLNARYFLGQSYQKAGRLDDARTQYNILDKIIPNNQIIKDAINSLSKPVTPEPIPLVNTTKTKDSVVNKVINKNIKK